MIAAHRLRAGLLRRIHRNLVDPDREGVDFWGRVTTDAMTVGSANRDKGENYGPTPPQVVRQLIRRLRLDDYAAYSFIDFGSGKGAALAAAAPFGFRQVIGVEYASDLSAVAARNLAILFPGRSDILAVHGDATDYALPDTPCVIFLYNPFNADVLEPVIANVEASWQAHRRDIRVIYVNPRHEHVLRAHAFLRPVPAAAPARALDWLTAPHGAVIYRSV